MIKNQLRIFAFILALCIGGPCYVVLAGNKLPHTRLKNGKSITLSGIPEPSDIVYDPETNHLFIVSDHGTLFECDADGKIIRQAKKEGLDFEGVEIKDGNIWVSDETARMVYQYRKADLEYINRFPVKWGGAMNRGYESLAWNPVNNCFILIAEQPAVIVEHSLTFEEGRHIPFKHVRDISAARYYDGFLYLLSDLNHMVIRCDAHTYEPLAYYSIAIINPEGLAFGSAGKMMITSDNEQKLYFFNALPLLNQQ